MREEHLLDVVGHLYEAAATESGFDQALDGLRLWLGADSFHLMRWNDASGVNDLSMQSPQLREAAAAYQAHFGKIDPRRSISAMAPVGQPVACHHHFDDRFVSRSEFYQDLLLKHDVRYAIGLAVHREQRSVAHLVLNHSAAKGPFRTEQIEALRRLAPTLARAYVLMQRTAGLRHAARGGELALNAWGRGIIVLGRGAELIWCNASARDWIGAGRLFHLHGTRLSARGSAGTRLERALAAAVNGPVHWVARSYPQSSRDRLQRAALTLTRSSVMGAPGLHALLIQNLEPPAAVPATALAEWFDLTPAQARVASLLTGGLAPQDIAVRCGVSLATVRTQIRQLLARSEAANLQEFLRLAASLLVLAHASDPESSTSERSA
uniref:Transcriptional regulator, LuxR family n=1 Tax=Thiomonas intermedia (strain K12) TaxID=75379 RepID=D5WYU2_THIK1